MTTYKEFLTIKYNLKFTSLGTDKDNRIGHWSCIGVKNLIIESAVIKDGTEPIAHFVRFTNDDYKWCTDTNYPGFQSNKEFWADSIKIEPVICKELIEVTQEGK